MAATKTRSGHSANQYRTIERKHAERHYYLDGEIYALAGESGNHGDISANLVELLHSQLKGKRCPER